MQIFKNPRWPTAAILKIVKSPYLSEKLSDFDTIRYTTANVQPDCSHVTKVQSFKIQDGGDSHLENRFFGRNSSTDCPISAKFCVRKQNRMPTKAAWKLQIFKIQDGGRPPFWKSFYHHISVKNLPISMKFGTQHQILNPITVTWPKIEIIEIRDGGSRHLENRFFGQRLSDISEILHPQEAERHADKGRMTKTANFQNPRLRTAAILKIVKSPYLSETIIGFWQNLVYILYILNLMRFSKALSQYLRCDKVTINE